MKRAAFAVTAGLILLGSTASAYVLSGYKWSTTTVPYYINPANADVGPDATEASIVAGANAWAFQSNANVALTYAGRTTTAILANDHQNTVFFRSDPGDGTIAETYSWYSGGKMVDADTVYHDGDFLFFPGDTGCSGGFYIQDIATHEFGHMLGLAHSPVTEATMYYGIGYCSQEWRSLASDDQDGIETLYPPVSTSTTVTGPSVVIYAPANNTSANSSTTISFSGNATDSIDGNLSGAMSWTSSIDGNIGTGASFSRTLSAGTHVITTTVTDSSGLSSSSSVTISVTSSAPVPTTPTLTVKAGKGKGKQAASAMLSWTGLSASLADVFRNGVRIVTASNSGSYTDTTVKKGGGSYSYTVCASGTSTCTNQASIVF